MRSSSPAPHALHVETLLSQSDRIRRLVGGLLADPATADDAVQDAWVTALERPTRRVGNDAGWFASVVRNAARQLVRGEARRKRREEDASRPDAQPSTIELVERQRDVLSHVLALDEPYRSTVLARFFEDLPPREIAAREGVSVKTVDSRLQRAFAKLRSKLDGEYGSRESWCVALLPLAAGPHGKGTAALSGGLAGIGGWIVHINLKLVLLGSLAAAGGLGLWAIDTDRDTPLPDVGGAPRLEEVAEPLAIDADASSAIGRVAEELAIEPEEPAVASNAGGETVEVAATSALVRGRVVDPTGAGVADVAVVDADDEERTLARTDATGAFELRVRVPFATAGRPSGIFRALRTMGLAVRDDALAVMCDAVVREASIDREHVIVVTRAVDLEGVVVDPGAAPIENATLVLQSSDAGFAGMPYALDSAQMRTRRTTTDAAGRFALDHAALGAPVALVVHAPGFATKTIDTSALLSDPLVIELEPGEVDLDAIVSGVVLDERGAPFAGATVHLANVTTESDDDGRFSLERGRVEPATPLVAIASGRQPAIVPDFGALIEMHGGVLPFQRLYLGPEALELEGRIVDDEERPMAGWYVALEDETAVSVGRIPVVTAEGLVRGAPHATLRTGEDGRFRIGGLVPREYELLAYDRASLTLVRRTVFVRGDPVEIRVEAAETGDVRGRVVSSSGAPIEGARVQPALHTQVTEYGSSFVTGAATTTDAFGRFELHDVPREHVTLRVHGEHIGATEVEPFETSGELEIVVTLMRTIRIECADPTRPADEVRLVDASGHAYSVSRGMANSSSAWISPPLTDGRSEVLSVSDAACFALVYRGGVEVARVPITFDPDGITVLEL